MSGPRLKPNSDCEKRKPASCVLHHTLSKNDAQIFFQILFYFSFHDALQKGLCFLLTGLFNKREREREREAELTGHSLGSTEREGH